MFEITQTPLELPGGVFGYGVVAIPTMLVPPNM